MTIGTKTNKSVIVWRIEGIDESIPELIMRINLENIDLSYQQIINETRTLGGFLQEFWGEELTSLSASGKTAMSYDENGITNKNARVSEAYQNLLRLVNIYKNNGKVYTNPNDMSTASKANPNRIKKVGEIIMTYQQKEYVGYFEAFSIKENASNPYYFDYTLSYKISKTKGDLVVSNGGFISNGGI